MTSVTASPLRKDLPQWFLDRQTPTADELEQMGIATTSLENAANLFTGWGCYDDRVGSRGDQEIHQAIRREVYVA